MDPISAFRSLAPLGAGNSAALAPLQDGLQNAQLKKISANELSGGPVIHVEPPAAGAAARPSALGAGGAGSFEGMLNQFVHEVSGKQAAANESATRLLSGQKVSLHQAMIAMEEASVSFQLMVEVRNRLLDSYQELMRMQV